MYKRQLQNSMRSKVTEESGVRYVYEVAGMAISYSSEKGRWQANAGRGGCAREVVVPPGGVCRGGSAGGLILALPRFTQVTNAECSR